MPKLTLTRDEVRMLYSVLGRIGGDPHRSPRRLVDSVFGKLEAAGLNQELPYEGDDPSVLFMKGSGVMYFQSDNYA